MRTKITLTFLCAGLFLLRTSGQEKLILSLEEARKHAIEYNKTVQNADLAIVESQKKINETLSAGLPQADVTIDYSNFLVT